MSKTESARYQAERAKLAVQPVYLLRFFHVARVAGSAEYAFSRDFLSFDADLPRKPALRVLGRPGGNVQTVRTEEGQSSIGTFTIPLLDSGGEVLRQVSNPQVPLAISLSIDGGESTVSADGPVTGYPARGTIEIEGERIRYTGLDGSAKQFTGITRAVDGTSLASHNAGTTIHNGEQIRAGQRAQLLAGYRTLDESQYLTFVKMEVAGVSLLQDGVTFVIRLTDIQRALRRILFSAATPTNTVVLIGNPITLALRILLSTGGVAVGDGTVQVTGATTVTGTGTAFRTFLKAGDFVLIDSFTASEQLAEVAAVVSDTEFTSVESLTTTGVGLSYRKAGTAGRYDVLDLDNGLAVPSAFVDLSGLEQLRDVEFPGEVFSFTLTFREDGKAFLEREIWRVLNCVPFITQDGQYSAKRYKHPPPATVAVTLTEDDIVALAWDGTERLIINQIEFQYDWDATAGEFTIRQIYTANASKDKYGLRPIQRIESKGIRTDQGGQSIMDDRALQLLQRFSDPPATLLLTLRYSHHVLDIGEIVGVTHRNIPNRRTGERGMTDERFEIRDLRPLFGAEGKMIVQLLHVGAQAAINAPQSSGAEAI